MRSRKSRSFGNARSACPELASVSSRMKGRRRPDGIGTTPPL
ncbi:MAG: hypothetical protein R2825_16595 [Saprospiraceae bacterium]